MTYNLTLANVVPAASAFSVRVNSTARTVNTVAISGTKVQLTLASPVVYGDVVTVSYTKPSVIHCRQHQEDRLQLSVLRQLKIILSMLAPTAEITSPGNNSIYSFSKYYNYCQCSDPDGSVFGRILQWKH